MPLRPCSHKTHYQQSRSNQPSRRRPSGSAPTGAAQTPERGLVKCRAARTVSNTRVLLSRFPRSHPTYPEPVSDSEIRLPIPSQEYYIRPSNPGACWSNDLALASRAAGNRTNIAERKTATNNDGRRRPGQACDFLALRVQSTCHKQKVSQAIRLTIEPRRQKMPQKTRCCAPSNPPRRRQHNFIPSPPTAHHPVI